MGTRGSGWVKEAHRYLLRGPDPQLLHTTLRLRWISAALGVPIFGGVCLLFGSTGSLYAFGIAMLAYLLVNAGLSRALRRSRSLQLWGCLSVVGDLAALTVTLTIFDQLQGPLVGMYAMVLLGSATMWSGLATVIAGMVGVGCYATVLGLTLGGVLPAGAGLERLQSLDAFGFATLVPLALLVLFTGYTVILNYRLLRDRAASVEDRYRALFNRMPTPIFVVDQETGRYLECNEASRQFTGLSRDQFIGRMVGNLLEPEDRADLEALVRQAANAPTRTLLRRWAMKSGREFFSEMALTPVEFKGREAVLMAGRDCTAEVRLDEERREYAAKLQREVAQRTQDLERTNTKLRQLQTRLVEAERLGIAGEVAGGIAHAIYNPLAALIGHMEMKLDSDKVDPRDEHVMHLARRIEAVVEGMLTLSRRGTMRPEPMDLGDLVREVRRELAERCLTQGVEVELRIAPNLPQLTADHALLTTALVSVAENALDAMENGGKLVLAVESVSETDALRLRVRDSGPGVPAKIRGRIFEPFYSTKLRGVGLGLAIARGIILGHEGSIRLESEPGSGTEVTLEIPQQGVREARR